MTHRTLGTLFLLALAAPLAAQDAKTGFLDKTFKDGTKYVVFIPHDYTPEKTYPVILFLHGSGESGTDGQKQVGTGLGKAIKKEEKTFPFITLFPQSQKGGWKATGDEAQRALAILDETMKTYKIDEKRQYLTGLSMGGFGTWSLAAEYPTRWAAIAPICGGGDPGIAPKIKDIPCWNFCGDADKLVVQSRKLIAALKEAGGNPIYTEYPGVGHNSWDNAYGTAKLYEWFLMNPRK